MSTTTDRTATRRPALLLHGTRALLALFGAAKLFGTTYFTFFATVEEGRVQSTGDWLVAAWSAALAVAFLVAAVRLGGDRRVLPVLAGVLLLDLVFSAVKLTVYDEPEAVLFMAVDLVIIGLLTLISRRRRATE